MTPASLLTPEKRKSLPKFDNTKMTAINTCPTWGLVRYDQHKTPSSGNNRAMALEAGSAAHEAYAAMRLADLYLNGEKWYPELDVKIIAGQKMVNLFGEIHATELLSILYSDEDPERKFMLVGLERFAQSGYYEDPNDRRRTVANIEESLIAYAGRYPFGETMPIIIDDFVGVEIPVDMYCKFEYSNDSGEIITAECRFTGRVDGVHYKTIDKKTIVIEENKTSSRLDDSWQLSFELAHQVTGYTLAISAMLDMMVNQAIVRGMAIPLPKNYDYGGIVNVPTKRQAFQVNDWVQWFVYTYHLWTQYKDDPTNAPKMTHSCNRYFRICPLHSMCLSPPDERLLMLDEMRKEEWSPLETGAE